MFNEISITTSLKSNLKRMLFFGILAAVAANIKFSIPGTVGATSDAREIVLLLSVAYFSNVFYALGVGFLASLGGPYEHIYTVIVMHLPAVLLSWFFFDYIRDKIKRILFLSGAWFVFVLLLYLFVYSGFYVLSEFIFGGLDSIQLFSVYKAFITGVGLEAVVTAVITSLLVYMLLLQKKYKETATYLKLAEKSIGLVSWYNDLEKDSKIYNEQWASLLGYTEKEVRKIENLWERSLHPDDSEHVYETLNNHLKGDTEFYQADYRLRTKSGSYKWIYAIGRVLQRDEANKALKISGIYLDVTKRKLLEQKNKNLQMQIFQSQKMDAIGQLAGGIAHDFNNILSGIMGATQLLKLPKRDLDEESLVLVDMIQQSSERAADLTAKLLAFGRKNKIMFVTVDVDSIIDDTVSILSKTVDKKITITVDKTAGSSLVEGESASLQSAFLNIGINASHAMPDGGEISIRTKNIYFDSKYCAASSFEIKAGNFVEVEIKDTGCGVSESDIKKIFEPFYTTKKQGKGTGLGLAAVYGIVQKHHGSIEVSSVLGKGTTFYLYFPCSEKKLKKNGEEVGVKQGSGLILLVDDEEAILITGKHILENMGYKVLLAKDGKEAVDIFHEKFKEIDLVLMDFIMPVLNGEEAFWEMKKIDGNCKVIISSGHSKKESLNELMKKGLVDFIQKPYGTSELSQLLAKALNSKE